MVIMRFFNEDFIAFFQELELNNSKHWFENNRKRYENSIKKPFKNFVLELRDSLQELYPETDLSDKYSIMRLNRDIRFGNDKTPYKTHMACMIMPQGKRDKTRPGFYLQANHRDIRVYSGAHELEKEQLYAIRDHIKNNLREFNSLILDRKFSAIFGEIQGEKHKRLPPEFKNIESEQPLIANKNFYWYFKLDPQFIKSDKLIDRLIENYQTTLPLNRFFERAFIY